jgi:hypothetical protein
VGVLSIQKRPRCVSRANSVYWLNNGGLVAQLCRIAMPHYPALFHDEVTAGQLEQRPDILVDDDLRQPFLSSIGKGGPYLGANDRRQPLGCLIEH